ncbi:flagellin, partial [Rhizobium sp. 2YAF20]|uniref:flagellin N-terminal helical domain-containing protein n=1 Tax=Rhizobium sp. 2YAF20 TaxID=3233027 RepID=UPI003F956A07
MTSIITNNAAMAALQTLRGINSNLTMTQKHVSTGLRISTASDNAAYWSIATTMKSDNGAMSAVSDALGLGAAKVDTASTAMDSAISIVESIKAKLVTAEEGSVNKSNVQDEITQLQQQLSSVAQSASFSGQNWVIASSGASASVVSSFIRSATGGVSVQSTSYTFSDQATGNVLFGSDSVGVITTSSGILGTVTSFGASSFSVYSLDITNMTSGGIDTALTMVEGALKAMTAAGSQLGSLTARIDLQTTFVSSLSDAISSGVGKLVDANMEQESSKLSALQTQQQLAVQS